jgi:hypothetical protein
LALPGKSLLVQGIVHYGTGHLHDPLVNLVKNIF